MIVQCPRCGKKYKFDEKRFSPDEMSKKVRCKACGTIFEIFNPYFEDKTQDRPEKTAAAPPEEEDKTDTRKGLALQFEKEEPFLPESYDYVLYITKGAKEGFKFKLTKPVVVIGRYNADLIIPDREVSRKHAVIEVYGDRVIIKDLNSTNGTYVDGKRVFEAELEDQSEILVGSTTLLFIKVKKDLELI